MELNEKNIEEQILLYVDGELSQMEEQALIAYLNLHPEDMDLLNQYQQAKMPMERVVFPGMDDLLKREQKTIRFTHYWKKSSVGIAAAVLLALVLTVAYQWHSNDAAQPVPLSNLAVEESFGVDTPQKQQKRIMPASEKKPSLEKQVVRKIKGHLPTGNQNETNKPKMQEEKKMAYLPTVLPKVKRIRPEWVNVALVPLHPYKEAVEGADGTALKKSADNDVLNKLIAASEKSEKLQGINDILNQVQDKKRTIQSGWENLKHSRVVLQLGNQEIVFNPLNKK